MPTISTFYGILIRMFFNDHPPPHFHARYSDFEATIDIESLSISEDHLPARALALIKEWAMIHKRGIVQELAALSRSCAARQIDPLV